MSGCNCNAAALRGASRRVSQFYDDALASTGLRGTQYHVLTRIEQHGCRSLNDLAQDLAMDRSTLGHNLRPLERDGYVVLGVDAEDRRTRKVGLTPRGKKKLAEARPLWRKANDRFEKAFGTSRAEQLRKLLAELASEDFLVAGEGQVSSKAEARRDSSFVSRSFARRVSSGPPLSWEDGRT